MFIIVSRASANFTWGVKDYREEASRTVTGK